MRKAVDLVLREHGPDALGRNAKFNAQRTRLRMNAKTYEKSKQFRREREASKQGGGKE